MGTENLAHILSPAIKRSLADEVAASLRKAILHGPLTPEEPLREAVLSELLGVSRGPVREALNCLAREGLVINRPNGRWFVARLSQQDAEEVFSLRQAIERLAIAYACRRASQADLDEMQAVVDEMAAATQRGATAQEAAEQDLRFHDLLYRASGHQRLLSFWTTLRPQIHIFLLSRNVASPDFSESAAKGHQTILDAIKDHDTIRAQAVLEEHLNFGYDRVLGSYDRSDEGKV